ncbi:MAG: LacI family DNA-binding transcriptional regulator [Trueperaceae bacterium]|nr:LacI family DNA-binding transcriptional regulator [Trueperaceae bacterium]
MASRIKDVARLAGVSSATVSRVLANKPHVRDSVKNRVLAAVNELGYEPNRVARSLRVQRSSIIGLIISDVQNSFFNTVVRAIEDSFYEHGYAVFLCNSDEDPEKERMYLNLLKAERVAGVILTPTGRAAETLKSLVQADIPVVVIDRAVPGLELDTVTTNNQEAAYTLVKHLIKQGHRKIAGIFPDLSITTGLERYEGYSSALKEAGLPVNPALIKTGKPVTADGYTLARELLKEQPDAIFSATKLMTLGVLRAVQEKGLSIPEDITLAAFDKLDWMPFQPQMSFAEQPTYDLGKTAAQLLLDRFIHPDYAGRKRTLKTKLHFDVKEADMVLTAQGP